MAFAFQSWPNFDCVSCTIRSFIVLNTLRYRQIFIRADNNVSIIPSPSNRSTVTLPTALSRRSQLPLYHPCSATALGGPGPTHHRRFTITLRQSTLGNTSLDEWSDAETSTTNTHKRQKSMPPAGFEPTIPARARAYT